MSLKATIWVMDKAPVKSFEEIILLYALANGADEHGRNTWLQREQAARRIGCSLEDVTGHLEMLEQRGVISKGNQEIVSHYPVDRRPTVWDLNCEVVDEAREVSRES